MKEKKKFKDTKFAAFLNKAGNVIKDNGGNILDIGAKVATGNISGAIAEVSDMLKKSDDPESFPLLDELHLKMKEFEVELEQAYLADVQNARQMQVEALQQESWLAKHFLYILASVIVAAAIAFGVMLFYVTFPEENRRMVEMFVDIFLFSGALMVLNFFFGSSKGSADKNGTIDKLKSIVK